MLTHGSLFSGIGAPELAAEWMGWNNVFHCEWEAFPRRVLEYYWPNSISYGDITKTDFTIHRGRIDILTGGFPCQPYSAAGKRLGKADSRHLWPEMLRAIREIQPRWVVGENVSGLINWSKGLVFEEVQADLESAGYSVIPFVLPACGVNAPHRRDRVWFVAYRNGELRRERGEYKRREQPRHREGVEADSRAGLTPDTNGTIKGNKFGTDDEKEGAVRGYEKSDVFGELCCYGPSPDTETTKNSMYGRCVHGKNEQKGAEIRQQRDVGTRNTDRVREPKMAGPTPDTDNTGAGERLRDNGERTEKNKRRERQPQSEFREIGGAVADAEGGRPPRKEHGKEKSGLFAKKDTGEWWTDFPTQPPVCGGNDGLPTKLDGITFPKWRNESIKAYGNAMVPQVIYQIFKAIQEYETNA